MTGAGPAVGLGLVVVVLAVMLALPVALVVALVRARWWSAEQEEAEWAAIRARHLDEEEESWN